MHGSCLYVGVGRESVHVQLPVGMIGLGLAGIGLESRAYAAVLCQECQLSVYSHCVSSPRDHSASTQQHNRLLCTVLRLYEWRM